MSLFTDLQHLLGEHYVQSSQQVVERLTDRHRRYKGNVVAAVRPANTSEVAAVVHLCGQYAIPIVVQGGNTGLMGAATPDESGRSVLLLLDRLDRIRAIDTHNDTITVEAGCILQNVQNTAQQAGRLFPLSLASEGSCTIGGNLGTNAGGNAVLRFGNARELTLGLEVVTAEGEVWEGLSGLRKDNTGYDLRNLYIGSEGTLGIITAATLKLYPLPNAQCTAFVAFESLSQAVNFLSFTREAFGASLTAFELMSGPCLSLLASKLPDASQPFKTIEHAWYALIEISDHQNETDLKSLFEKVLFNTLTEQSVADVLIAQSGAQREALWHLRESLSEAQARDGANAKHDISVPISRVVEFVERTDALLQQRFPGVRHFTFGHLGDGNLHYNVASPKGQSSEDFLAHYAQVSALVHDTAHALGGSISAEHGIGQRKRELMSRYKSAVELDLMQRIKDALDPHGLLNPGKVLPVKEAL